MESLKKKLGTEKAKLVEVKVDAARAISITETQLRTLKSLLRAGQRAVVDMAFGGKAHQERLLDLRRMEDEKGPDEKDDAAKDFSAKEATAHVRALETTMSGATVAVAAVKTQSNIVASIQSKCDGVQEAEYQDTTGWLEKEQACNRVFVEAERVKRAHKEEKNKQQKRGREARMVKRKQDELEESVHQLDQLINRVRSLVGASDESSGDAVERDEGNSLSCLKRRLVSLDAAVTALEKLGR